jgi:hypothetical protein
MHLHNLRWQVSLANGDTFIEGSGLFDEVAGELSPWQKLLRYKTEQNTHITSLSLLTNDGRTFNLPSAGKNPKFIEFDGLEKPTDYLVCRKISRKIDIAGNTQEVDWLFTVAIAKYADYELQLWVDEKNTSNMWTMVCRK